VTFVYQQRSTREDTIWKILTRDLISKVTICFRIYESKTVLLAYRLEKLKCDIYIVWVGVFFGSWFDSRRNDKNDQFVALISKTNSVTTETTKEFSIIKDIATVQQLNGKRCSFY